MDNSTQERKLSSVQQTNFVKVVSTKTIYNLVKGIVAEVLFLSRASTNYNIKL